MSMATVPPWDRKVANLSMPVTPANAEERENLTCLLCWGSRVQWVVTMRHGGRRIWAGLHEECIAAVETRGTTSPGGGA